MKITFGMSRSATLSSEVHLHELLERTSGMKRTTIKCKDTDGDIQKASICFGWVCIDEENSSDGPYPCTYYRINVEDKVDKVDLSEGMTRKETKKKWGSMLLIYVSPYGDGMKHNDIVSYLSNITDTPPDKLIERIPDIPVLVQQSDWTDGHGFQMAKAIFDDGYIE